MTERWGSWKVFSIYYFCNEKKRDVELNQSILQVRPLKNLITGEGLGSPHSQRQFVKIYEAPTAWLWPY